ADLERLRGILERSGNNPHLLEIVGEAGIGKTRLLAEALANRGAWIGTCQSLRQNVAFSLVASLLESWLVPASQGGTEGISSHLRRALAGLSLPDPERTVALLSRLFEPQRDLPEGERMDPEHQRGATLYVLDELVVALSRRLGRLVLAIDDMQWIDAASRDWLVGLLDLLASGVEADFPITLVIAVRSDATPPLRIPVRLAYDRIVLRALAVADSLGLFGDLLRLPPDRGSWPGALHTLADQVVARAEGNPFYLEELVASLWDRRLLASLDGKWNVPQRLDELEIPPTIQGLVASRLDRLAMPLRSTLQVAAAIGRTFSAGLLEQLKGTDELDQLLEDLVRGGFLMSAGPRRFAFAQAITHEVVYASMLLSVRRELHRRIAETLTRSNAPAAPLAHHWLLADDKAMACLCLKQAGDEASAQFDNKQALAAYREALATFDGLAPGDQPVSSLRRDELLRLVAEAEIKAGDPRRALALGEAALRTAEDTVAAVRSRMIRGAAFERLGSFPEALAEYRLAEQSLDGGDRPDLLAQLLVDSAFLHHRLGDGIECSRLCMQVLAMP
ncbi:MAG: AAA family ATPase, partial [Cyanobacteria bacterium REEB65]|nr:AAA family ATPase [Cyanobacteria bacterium REEB65]